MKFAELCRLRRAGNVIRMEESDPAKKVLCSNQGGNGERRRGRPKLRWWHELEEWQQLIEEVKCHPVV
jgi:hypothetical protein